MTSTGKGFEMFGHRMVVKMPEWVTCGEAHRLVREICRADPGDTEPFRSILKLAFMGQIRMTAENAEICGWDSSGALVQSIELDLSEPRENFATQVFLQHLLQRYGNDDQNLSGFSCFLTGTFEFPIEIDNEPLLCTCHVTGLKFERTDLVRLFGSQLPATTPEPSKRGRTKGSGSFEQVDAPFLAQMHELILSGKAASPEAAAGLVAGDAHGAGDFQSKKTRLAKRYRAAHPRAERKETL